MNGLIEFIIAGTSFHNSYGKLTVTPEQLADGVSEFNALPEVERRLPIKYGTHKQGTDAAGWIKGLVGIPADKPEKVVATVEWNDMGAAAVKEKRQLYISPEFSFNWTNNKTGKKGFSFLGAALLNDPHLTPMGPAVAFDNGGDVVVGASMPLDSVAQLRVQMELTQGGLSMEMREKLCTMLGLETTASDDDLVSKLGELQKAASEKAEIEVELSASKAKESEVVTLTAQIEATQKTIAELEVKLSAANEAAAAAASEKLDVEAKQATEALIAQGKALPRERDVLLSAYKKDPESCKAQWALRGAVVELSKSTGISDPHGLSAIELAAATQKKLEAEGKTPYEAAVEAMKIQQGQ